MRAYYNEFEPAAAQWLENLIAAGKLPAGDVDTRSITDVHPDDLAGYTQCHFFAGIGGWGLAARLAGWPDDRPLWTGSPPCQPFSVAGKGQAQSDHRHLWPDLFRLIRARRPPVFVGEQVAAAVGRDWLDGVLSDLEGIDYAGRSVIVPACAVNAPHRRDRLWTLAHTDNPGPQGFLRHVVRTPEGWSQSAGPGAAAGILDREEHAAGHVAHTDIAGTGEGRIQRGRELGRAGGDQGARDGQLAHADGFGLQEVGDGTDSAGLRFGGIHSAGSRGCAWGGAGWIPGHDGKARRFEPRIPLLAHGVSGRMAVVRPGFEGNTADPDALHWYSRIAALKGFGNAIVPQVAAELLAAWMDVHPLA